MPYIYIYIYVEHVWNMYEICIGYGIWLDHYETCTEDVWNMYGICVEKVCNMSGVSME